MIYTLKITRGSGASFVPAVMPQGYEEISPGGVVEAALQTAYERAREAGEAWALVWGDGGLLTELNTMKVKLAGMIKPKEQYESGYTQLERRITQYTFNVYQAASNGLDKTLAAMEWLQTAMRAGLQHMNEHPKDTAFGTELLRQVDKTAAALNLNYAGFRALQDLAFQGLLTKVQAYETTRSTVWSLADELRRFLARAGAAVEAIAQAIKDNLPKWGESAAVAGVFILSGVAALLALWAWAKSR